MSLFETTVRTNSSFTIIVHFFTTLYVFLAYESCKSVGRWEKSCDFLYFLILTRIFNAFLGRFTHNMLVALTFFVSISFYFRISCFLGCQHRYHFVVKLVFAEQLFPSTNRSVQNYGRTLSQLVCRQHFSLFNLVWQYFLPNVGIKLWALEIFHQRDPLMLLAFRIQVFRKFEKLFKSIWLQHCITLLSA